jgi:hypothetical protein
VNSGPRLTHFHLITGDFASDFKASSLKDRFTLTPLVSPGRRDLGGTHENCWLAPNGTKREIT